VQMRTNSESNNATLRASASSGEGQVDMSFERHAKAAAIALPPIYALGRDSDRGTRHPGLDQLAPADLNLSLATAPLHRVVT